MTIRRLAPAMLLAAFTLAGCTGGGIQGSDNYQIPRFIGAGLGTSQEELNKLTLSKGSLAPSDATGQGRAIELTDDWKVCQQSIKPGSEAAKTVEIGLGVVQVSEECPSSDEVDNTVGEDSTVTENPEDYVEAEKYFVARQDDRWNGKPVETFQAEQEDYTFYRYFNVNSRVVVTVDSQSDEPSNLEVCSIDVVKDREDYAMVAVAKPGECKAN